MEKSPLLKAIALTGILTASPELHASTDRITQDLREKVSKIDTEYIVKHSTETDHHSSTHHDEHGEHEQDEHDHAHHEGAHFHEDEPQLVNVKLRLVKQWAAWLELMQETAEDEDVEVAEKPAWRYRGKKLIIVKHGEKKLAIRITRNLNNLNYGDWTDKYVRISFRGEHYHTPLLALKAAIQILKENTPAKVITPWQKENHTHNGSHEH